MQDICAGGLHGDLSCVPTFLAAVTAADGKAPNYAPGCDVGTPDPSGIAAAVAACNASDVCLVALGDNTEGEGNDRGDTSLPGAQGALAAAIIACGKPTVFIIFSGATLAIDSILSAPPAIPISIIVAWMPGVVGGMPVAAALFGAANAWGKLPVSWYPEPYFSLLPIQDMDMVHGGGGAGRTYKYYNASAVGRQSNTTGALLYPFGHGLSYTTFTLSGTCPNNPPKLRLGASPYVSSAIISCTVTVANTGTRDGDEVVTVYVVPNATAVERARTAHLAGSPRRDPLASRLLIAFERVHIAAGAHVDIPFNFSAPTFASIDDDGARVIFPGDYSLRFSRGAGDDVDVPITIELEDGMDRLITRAAYPIWW